MKLLKNQLVYALTFVLFYCSLITGVSAQSQQEINNLKAFTKAYGYVKYFHPSTEADQLDWGWFSVYGASQVRDCKESDCLSETLNTLFEPIAPTVRFSADKPESKPLKLTATPPQPKDYRQVYWQHYGVGKDMINPSELYKSVRVNSQKVEEKSAGFGGINKRIPAEPYLNRRIRLKGMAKLDPSSEGTGHFWLRVDNSDQSPGFFENMNDNPISTADWQPYTITGNVNPKASTINFGGFLSGKGTLHLDMIELEVEENGSWTRIPINNSSFEDPIEDQNWISMGKGYQVMRVVDDLADGTQALEINYVGAPEAITQAPIFQGYPDASEIWTAELTEGLWIAMPLVLYEKDLQTYPIPTVKAYNPDDFTALPTNADGLDFRLGNIINTWNVFQHFYPYFKETGVAWESELEKSLKRTYTSNEQRHYRDLKELTATLKDGHIQVYGKEQGLFAPPINWEWAEGKLILTQVFDSTLGLTVGDVVEAIDGNFPQQYFDQVKAGISAATTGYLNYRANDETLMGAKDSRLTITVEGREHELVRSMDYHKNKTKLKASLPQYKLLDDGIVYLNLDLISTDTIKRILPELENSKAIIADLRGYPKSNHEFINLLLDKADSSKWMMVNQYIYPDQQDIMGHSDMGWEMVPEKPHLGNKKVIFITDGQAISYAESYLGFIEANKLALIIGQPTAGTNGNINMFALPGEMGISFTGMKVVKHDGSQLHGIGIIPDIYLEKTIKGITEGRDEFLEKAIELAKNE